MTATETPRLTSNSHIVSVLISPVTIEPSLFPLISIIYMTQGTVDSNDSLNNSLNMIAEPGQDMSFVSTSEEIYNAPASAIPYMLPTRGSKCSSLFSLYSIQSVSFRWIIRCRIERLPIRTLGRTTGASRQPTMNL